MYFHCSLFLIFFSVPSFVPSFLSQIPEAITNFISGPLKAILATFHRTFLKYTDPEMALVSTKTSKSCQIDVIHLSSLFSLFFFSSRRILDSFLFAFMRGFYNLCHISIFAIIYIVLRSERSTILFVNFSLMKLRCILL